MIVFFAGEYTIFLYCLYNIFVLFIALALSQYLLCV